MKIILTLIFMLSANITFAEDENPLAKVKSLHPDYTYVAIYNYSKRANGDLVSRKKIQLYDNSDFKGSPLYELDNETIIDNTSGEKKIFYYKDYYFYNTKAGNVNVKDMPFDFVRASFYGFLLGVSEHNNSIATVPSNDKKLFFKISLKELLGDEVTYVKWPTNRDVIKVKDFFLNEIKHNSSLHRIISSIKTCSEQKNASCLKTFLQNNNVGFPQYYYNILKVNRFFSSRKNEECEKNYRELVMTESDIYKRDYPEYLPWEFLKNAIVLERKPISLERTVKKMINKEVLSIRVMGNVECVAEEKLQMVLEKDLVSNNWKLLSFNFADTLSDE